jgi:hypothetical protein
VVTNDTRRPAIRPARRPRALILAATASMILLASPACSKKPEYRTFATPEDAVKMLLDTAKAGNLDGLIEIFGPEGKELIASSDAATARHNRQVFVVAMAEGWKLADRGPAAKELVVGGEEWPFPIPLIKEGTQWRFDTAAGKEEILARRIGRNELAVIRACQTYVLAQRAYAGRGHDGKPAGLYARRFESEPGKQNGLHWPAKRGEPRSPLGNLVAEAAAEGRSIGGQKGPSPFHGYYFRILEAQGPNAAGGAVDYVVNGEMSGGFALIAWPAEYDATGVMTFKVGADGVVYEKDLGPETAAAAGAIRRFDPDATWQKSDAEASGTPSPEN